MDINAVHHIDFKSYRGRIISPNIVVCNFCLGVLLYFGGIVPMHQKLKESGWVNLVGHGHVCPQCNTELSIELMDQMSKTGEVVNRGNDA